MAETVRRLSPGVIAITGDAVERNEKLPVLRAFLRLLPRAAKTYATLGNWEHWGRVDLSALADVYAQAGGQLLVNETARYENGGARLTITGLDDATAGRPDLDRALAEGPAEGTHLLLAHSPAYRDRLRRELAARGRPEAFQYMLSGHTHGGQVDLLGYKPFLPAGTGRYVEGWFRDSFCTSRAASAPPSRRCGWVRGLRLPRFGFEQGFCSAAQLL